MVQSFESFFSQLEIRKICNAKDLINFLVRERLKVTEKRKKHLKQGKPASTFLSHQTILRICPPRRQWARFRPQRKQRRDLQRSEIRARSLAVCLYQGLQKPWDQRPRWARDLCQVIEKLDQRYRSGTTLEFPRLIPIEKGPPTLSPTRSSPQPAQKETSPAKKYRVIVVQENFIDRMLHSLVSRYLLRVFRPSFSKNVYGLRRNQTSSDAIAQLIDYRQRFFGKVLWSSEVDIQQFFDTVSHKQVLASFQQYQQMHLGPETTIEAPALAVLDNFLQQYSFNKVEEILFDRWGLDSLMDRDLRNRLLELHGPFGYGIPQGSPFSGLIANLLLSAADHAVEEVLRSSPVEGFYARFVDDVILLHPQSEICQKMHTAYESALQDLGLFSHPAQDQVSVHPEEYLDQKTLLPYPWCHPTEAQGAHRWVAFLGYHLREDQQVRLRRSTFEKELHRQKEIVDDALQQLNQPERIRQLQEAEQRNKGQFSLAYLAEMRLVARTVGLDLLQGKSHLQLRTCWNAAFPHLGANQHGATQLRELDRHREKQLRRLRARLREVGLNDAWPEHSIHGRFCGHPFSYYSLVHHHSDRRLPWRGTRPLFQPTPYR